MGRIPTTAELELDKKLKGFGLIDASAQPDPTEKSGSEQAPPDGGQTGDEEVQTEGNQGLTETEGNQENDHLDDESREAGDEGDQNPDKPIKHNWEKRAKDNQRNFSKEKEARKRDAETYEARIAELEARLGRLTKQVTEEDEADTAFAEANGEVAEYLKNRERRRVESDISDIQESMEAEFKRTLSSMLPNWNKIISDPKFAEWKKGQRRSVQKVMESTFTLDEYGRFLYTPEDVLDVLDQFQSTSKGYQPPIPDEAQAPQAKLRKGEGSPSGNPPQDVFSLEEMNDPNLSDKFIGRARDRKKAVADFDTKYWRSVEHWRKKGYTSA